ncbi:MAG: DUF1353 domain-containing protein [Bacteroidales bacterium]|nr:DUF1353 domain-containing protein [Bacteroidales bacterium]
MKWLTDDSRLSKTKKPNKWLLSDNELFKDSDGRIYIVPRNYETDNYTIPDWLAWLGGNKSKWDVRPAHIHDFGCQFHQLIRVRLTEEQLKRLRLLKVHNNKVICENIPVKYLELVPVTKWEIDCLFKRAMKATKCIPPRAYNLYRGGVFFNVGWLFSGKPFDLNKIYAVGQNG